MMEDGLEHILDVLAGDIGGQDDWRACSSEIAATLRTCLNQLQGKGSSSSFNNLPKAGEALKQFLEQAHHRIQSVHHSKVERKWRRLFTDVSILKGIVLLQDRLSAAVRSEIEPRFILEAIRDLDIAIIQCGAPGHDRLEMIHLEISLLQRALPPLESSSTSSALSHCNGPEGGDDLWEESDASCLASTDVLELEEEMPSFEEYLCQFHRQPFVVRGYASEWPALSAENKGNDKRKGCWADANYLKKVAGPGRIVPVERGRQYTDTDWTQEIISWPDFLQASGWRDTNTNKVSFVQSTPPDSREQGTADQRILYLAQHNLLRQFPLLEADICIPDIVYSCPPAPDHFTTYKPPVDEEEEEEGGGLEACIINAWIGPKGTTTPAHFDPYYNAYVQVVGHKLVWIAPPDVFKKTSGRIPSDPNLETDGNTSTIDIFDSSLTSLDPRLNEVKKRSSRVILSPGDLLVMPPGWFHGMRSLTRSFSVSMWY